MVTKLRIGVTGHRPAVLAEADTAELAGRVTAMFAAIDAAMAGICAGDGREPHITLVTCGAAGADTLAIACARARGWAHETILPFPEAENALDFADGAEREAYRHDLATSRRVFVLDGSRRGGAVPPAARSARGDSADAQAYERAGRVLLAQSDLLVGIWNGGSPGGAGGTAHVIAEAVGAGVPVAHVPIAAGSAATLLWSGFSDHRIGEDTVETVARAGVERLGAILAATPGIGGDANAPGQRTPSGASALEAVLAWPYRALLWLTRARAPAVAAPAGQAEVRLDPQIVEGYATADRAASVAAAAYRGAYVANFALAAAAVLLSLSGLVLPAAAKPVLLIGEVVLIAAILTVTGLGRRMDWHRCWIEQRQLAERLKCLGLRAKLGDLGLRAGPARPNAAIHAQVCVAARDIALPDAAVTPEWLGQVHRELLALVDDQRRYFTREAVTMERLDRRLDHAGFVLFAATAIVCLGFVGLKAWIAIAGLRFPDELLRQISAWVTFLTAGFPTLGAALHGIRMQGDFASAAERSRGVEAQLDRLARAISAEAPSFDRLLVRMRRVLTLLTDDLDRWTHIYSARPLALPG